MTGRDSVQLEAPHPDASAAGPPRTSALPHPASWAVLPAASRSSNTFVSQLAAPNPSFGFRPNAVMQMVASVDSVSDMPQTGAEYIRSSSAAMGSRFSSATWSSAGAPADDVPVGRPVQHSSATEQRSPPEPTHFSTGSLDLQSDFVPQNRYTTDVPTVAPAQAHSSKYMQQYHAPVPTSDLHQQRDATGYVNAQSTLGTGRFAAGSAADTNNLISTLVQRYTDAQHFLASLRQSK